MLKNQRIGTRIGIGFGTLLVGAAAAFGAAVWVGLHGQRQAQAASTEMADRVAAVQNLQIAQLEAISSVRNAGLMTNARAVKNGSLQKGPPALAGGRTRLRAARAG